MITHVEYGKAAESLGRGRNNYFQQHGLEIMTGGFDEVELYPITSRGPSESARLVIPLDRIDAVIMALSNAKKVLQSD